MLIRKTVGQHAPGYDPRRNCAADCPVKAMQGSDSKVQVDASATIGHYAERPANG